MIIINPHNPIFPPLLRQWMLIVLFAFASSSLKAVNDTLKKKQPVYDLNDPRNPNCPCHKYQKLADEEFLKQKKQKNKKRPEGADNQEFVFTSNSSLVQKNIVLEEFNPKKINSNNVVQSREEIATNKRSKKRHTKMPNKSSITKLKFKIYKMYNNRRKVKFSKNYNNCFTWH